MSDFETLTDALETAGPVLEQVLDTASDVVPELDLSDREATWQQNGSGLATAAIDTVRAAIDNAPEEVTDPIYEAIGERINAGFIGETLVSQKGQGEIAVNKVLDLIENNATDPDFSVEDGLEDIQELLDKSNIELDATEAVQAVADVLAEHGLPVGDLIPEEALPAPAEDPYAELWK